MYYSLKPTDYTTQPSDIGINDLSKWANKKKTWGEIKKRARKENLWAANFRAAQLWQQHCFHPPLESVFICIPFCSAPFINFFCKIFTIASAGAAMTNPTRLSFLSKRSRRGEQLLSNIYSKADAIPRDFITQFVLIQTLGTEVENFRFYQNPMIVLFCSELLLSKEFDINTKPVVFEYCE